jgi:meiotically up-regulated gene 157 (Mug157) protein
MLYDWCVLHVAAAALERALEMNKRVWHSKKFEEKTSKLAADIRKGLEEFGIVDLGGGNSVYAYEVDGLGNRLTDFDDANVPSLLSIPLLGYEHFNKTVYATTRARLLSPATNRYYFKGTSLEGIGSPHTPGNNVWPMAMVMQGLTTPVAAERATQFRQLLKSQCGNGVMHESVNVNDPGSCTRPWFEWANALFVTYTRSALGMDCRAEAEAHMWKQLLPGNDDVRKYATLHNRIPWNAASKADANWFHT